VVHVSLRESRVPDEDVALAATPVTGARTRTTGSAMTRRMTSPSGRRARAGFAIGSARSRRPRLDRASTPPAAGHGAGPFPTRKGPWTQRALRGAAMHRNPAQLAQRPAPDRQTAPRAETRQAARVTVGSPRRGGISHRGRVGEVWPRRSIPQVRRAWKLGHPAPAPFLGRQACPAGSGIQSRLYVFPLIGVKVPRDTMVDLVWQEGRMRLFAC
jgi:hypothetical protein